MNGEYGKLPMFLVSLFAKLKTNALLVTLGLLGLVMLTGLSYTTGRTDGYELAESKYLKSVDQSKDRVIEELRVISDRQVAEILENRQTNDGLSRDIRNRFNQLEKELEDAVNAPTVINTDCRAEYDGTIGVFKSLATSDGPED